MNLELEKRIRESTWTSVEGGCVQGKRARLNVAEIIKHESKMIQDHLQGRLHEGNNERERRLTQRDGCHCRRQRSCHASMSLG
jgi:hypothetical protein